ncbi:rRNA pseudouridine synthase, partial [Candidatus Poribacteria bacterium]|nr:rRNA pseudouridine synthase [Candidatus Poribacteria bacterium]
MYMRLDKFLANAGVASRRAAKAIVHDGRVTVNGEVAPEPGVAVDENADDLRVD